MRKSLLLLALLPYVLWAQRTVTLDECQREAQQNYPLIKRYGLIEQMHEFTVSNIQKGLLPQISMNAQATLQSDVVALPDALQNMMQQYGKDVKGIKRDQYKIAIDVQQTLYDGGVTTTQKRVAEAQSEADKAQTDVVLYALRDRINQLYFALLMLDERIKLNQEMQTLLQANEDRLTTMLQNGVAMECDRNAVHAERLTTKQQMMQLEGQREAVNRVLCVFLGISNEPLQPQMPLNTLAMTDGIRPELTLFDKQLAITHQQEKALQSRLLPKLSLFAQGYYGYPGMNMYEDMFSHRWSLNGLVGARLTWNLSALYTHNNDRRKLSVRRSEIETQRETFLFNQRTQSTHEDATISSIRRTMQEDDEIIALREDVRRSAEAKLEHGIVDVTTLLQELTRENQARINKTTHEIELLQHVYNKKYIGYEN